MAEKKIDRPIPARYRDSYVTVCVDAAPIVMTAVGPRASVAYRWKCNRCGQVIQQNNAAAQSHTMKHVREVERQRKAVSR